MSYLKRTVINHIIEIEGGYVDDSDDSGGKTNFGVTEAVAREFGYKGNMIDMPRSLAFDVYADMYWNALKLDDIKALMQDDDVVLELADTSVNMGVGRAGKFLQRSLNALNNRGEIYADIVVDGQVGSGTLKALAAYIAKRGKEGENILCKMLNCLQGSFYVVLAERREKDERFIYGWYRNRI